LARFEGFPTKKLEVVRAAETLYSKLSSIADHLNTFQVVPPLSQQLDKVICYFDKVNDANLFYVLCKYSYLITLSSWFHEIKFSGFNPSKALCRLPSVNLRNNIFEVNALQLNINITLADPSVCIFTLQIC